MGVGKTSTAGELSNPSDLWSTWVDVVMGGGSGRRTGWEASFGGAGSKIGWVGSKKGTRE